jgi:hypothetical protein
MILPDFYLAYRANLRCSENGLDSKINCLDKEWFKSYPHQIEYIYNSRGYRDSEWPADLVNSVWCFGDSFTVGIGSPIQHTWPYLLENLINQRCINVSLDGGSNSWITRKVLRVLEEVKPQLIVIQWTYLHRNESSETSFDDESRRLFAGDDLLTKNLVGRFIDNINQVERSKGNTTVIHSMIPNAGPVDLLDKLDTVWNNLKGDDWPTTCPRDVSQLSDVIIAELTAANCYEEFVDSIMLTNAIDTIPNYVHYSQIDYARDRLHYDLLTARAFVNGVANCVANVNSSAADLASTSVAES